MTEKDTIHNKELQESAEFARLCANVHADVLEWLTVNNVGAADVLLAGYTDSTRESKGSEEFSTQRVDPDGNPVERFHLGAVSDLLHIDDEGKHANPVYFAVGRPLKESEIKRGYIGVYYRPLIEKFITEAEDPSEPEFGTVLAELSLRQLKDALLEERIVDIL